MLAHSSYERFLAIKANRSLYIEENLLIPNNNIQ